MLNRFGGKIVLSVIAGWRRFHGAAMLHCNAAAAAYAGALLVLGAASVALALAGVIGMPSSVHGQILAGCAIAVLAAMLPLRVPGTSHSLAVGEVFVVLLLLMHGPAAATLAAAGAGAVAARRWSHRLARPAGAALSMLALGSAFTEGLRGIGNQGVREEALVLLLAMASALGRCALETLLLAWIPHWLKRQRPNRSALFDKLRWAGATQLGSALFAGLLFLAFRATGIGVIAGALPIVVVLFAMLSYHFRRCESDERDRTLRIEAAEREAERSARHLRDLRESEQRLHSAFAHAAIGMMLVTPQGQVLQANPAMSTLLGHAENDLVGRHFSHFVHPEDLAQLSKLWQAEPAAEAGARAVELRCLRRNGEVVIVAMHSGRLAAGETSVPCLILQAQDVTARRRAEAQLRDIAYHDSLTALANRIHFGACLEQAIGRCRRDPAYRFAVMYLDFDRFKLINDTLGHAAGDRFLTIVARRIVTQVRPGDTVGRLGGDEFAVLVENPPDEPSTVTMAERLQRALAEPYDLDGTEVTSSASIGITFSSVGYTTPGDVLRDADIAMYRAKAAGRARVALFDASLRAQLAAEVSLERELRKAIERGQLTLAFQPIFDLETGDIHAFEALARWHHPELGPVPPASFLPVAEDSALMSVLTQWVLGEACAKFKTFRRTADQGSQPGLHVNVSGTDMCRANFVGQVSSALLVNGVEPSQLTLEITETTLMKRLDSALGVMGQLREIGVGLSVDDFGTGYSSLACLSTLPITSLKIDCSFVTRLGDDPKNVEVVKAVVTLGHALGKTVIAEGIETRSQIELLRQLGCELGQGYLLARPLRPEIAAAIARAADSLGARLPRPEHTTPGNCMVPTSWPMSLH